MQSQAHPLYSPDLEHVIDRCPLSVSPDTPLLEVVTRMGQTRGTCILSSVHSPTDLDEMGNDRPSYVLVVKADRLLGIFTERDAVRLSPLELDLARTPISQVMTRSPITLTRTGESNLFSALSLFRQHRIRHLPVVDERGQLEGVVTVDSVRRSLQPFNLLKLRLVAEVMTETVETAPPHWSVLQAAQTMTERHLSCLVIVQESPTGDRPIPLGMLTERDIVQFQTLGLNLSKLVAGEVMSAPPFCTHPDESLWVAHQQMQQCRVRRLTVVSPQGELVGLLSQTNLLQVFDPMAIYGVVQVLQHTVEERTDELQQVNCQLLREIEQRQQTEAELVRALAKERQLNELKSRFTSMVSHEFRNPLTTILACAQLLELNSLNLSEERKLANLQRIQTAAKGLNQTIEELLLLGQIEAGKFHSQPAWLDLTRLCREIVEHVASADNDAHPIAFEVGFLDGIPRDLGTHAWMSEKLVRHILTNLLSNACKYSPAGSPIQFELTYHGRAVQFKIGDRGIGIPETERDRVFDTFHRASNASHVSGTGLGLAIAKQCVEAQGGNITIDSQVNVGTTITVTLPLQVSASVKMRTAR